MVSRATITWTESLISEAGKLHFVNGQRQLWPDKWGHYPTQCLFVNPMLNIESTLPYGDTYSDLGECVGRLLAELFFKGCANVLPNISIICVVQFAWVLSCWTRNTLDVQTELQSAVSTLVILFRVQGWHEVHNETSIPCMPSVVHFWQAQLQATKRDRTLQGDLPRVSTLKESELRNTVSKIW